MSVDTNTLESITETIRSKATAAAAAAVAAGKLPFSATIKFNFKDGPEVVYIDGKSTPTAVHNNDDKADCTVTSLFEDFTKLVAGKLDPTTAFMMGKIKIDGDMGVAMKLGTLLSAK